MRRLVRTVAPALGLALAATATLTACSPTDDGSSDAVSSDDEDGAAYSPWSPKADGAEGLGGPITFSNACAVGTSTTITAVGDVLLHSPLQKQGLANADGFHSLWAPVADLLALGDVTYANFEGPSAEGVNSSGHEVTDPGKRFDNVVYTSYPQFNYHNSLIADLVRTGFDVVSTANNHALDRRQLGADKTIAAMKAGGLAYTGTRAQGDDTSPWYTITEEKGIKLAWLACTFSTNGLPDSKDQVLGCWEDEEEIKQLIADLKPQVDGVIITPHWGVEYQANPTREQRNLAHRFLDAGATMILGSHPHVLEPWEKYTTADGREAFVIYSMGNFVSGQSQLARRSTLMLFIGLTKTETGLVINGVRYLPLVMTTRSGVMAVESIDRAGGNAESRRLTTTMFGTDNIQDPAQPVVTNPGCD